MNELPEVTRVEVIDHRFEADPFGRVFVSGVDPGMRVRFDYQDDGRTLKVYLTDRKEEG